MYLQFPDITIKNILRYLNDNIRIIIMLRNPVDRAYSHYLMDFSLGLISKPFESILENEKRDIKAKLLSPLDEHYVSKQEKK